MNKPPPRSQGKIGRPAKVTREQIVDAAIAIIEERGPGQLSVRNVAQRLNVAPMTLYNHVRNREELETLIAARIQADSSVAWSPDTTIGWRDALKRSATYYEAIIADNPQLAQLRSVLVRAGWNFAGVEILLSRLQECGLDEQDAIRISHLAHLLYRGATDLTHAPEGMGNIAGADPRFDNLDPQVYPAFAQASVTSQSMDLTLLAAITFLTELVELLIKQKAAPRL